MLISSTFYVQLWCTQIPNARKKQSSQQCCLALWEPTGVKAVRWPLMKLSPGVNFINVLQTAFLCTDPKSAKKNDNLTVFFVLLGSGHVKAASRMLMKVTPEFWDSFRGCSYEIWLSAVNRDSLLVVQKPCN